jgi:hypothetical protein
MEQRRSRKTVRRALAVFVLALAVGGTWAGFNATFLEARYAAYRLRSAGSDDDRTKWADRLVAHGDTGLPLLVECVRSGDPACRVAAIAAIGRHLDTLPDGDPRAVRLGGQLLATFGGCDEASQAAILQLAPTVLKQAGAVHAAQCREVVAAGLMMPAVEARLVAIRLAMHPDVRLRADVLPLLSAAEPEVRRAAMFAVGPTTDDDPVIGDEELFRWLHDPDEGVRKVCYAALVSRGRVEPEIALGRRLVHPDPRERLELLRDLRYDDEVPDPEPWLERLGRDADPAVRAGAARTAVVVSFERRVPVPAWVGRLADADPDPTVRRIAHYYRSHPPARDGGIRAVGGP